MCEASPSVFLELPHGSLGHFQQAIIDWAWALALRTPPCLSHRPHVPVPPMPVCVHLMPFGSSGPGKPFCPGVAVL